jgi:hypothetical protein
MSLEQFLTEYEQEHTSRWTRLRRTAGTALVGAALMGLATGVAAQEPGQYAPYVDHDTTIVAFNPTDTPMTVTASYGLIGTDPRNGAQVQVTLPPHATATLPNALPSDPNPGLQTGSAYIRASGDDAPILTAATEHSDGSGMNIPILPADARNNTDPQAGILQTGTERNIVLSGDSTSNNTITNQGRGPLGGEPITSPPAYLPSNMITSGLVNQILNVQLPPNSSYTLIPQAADQSKAAGLLLYTNPASGDTRLRPMQHYTAAQQTPVDVAKAYVQQWLPSDGRVYFDNETARAIINGDGKGTPSYATALATILANSSGANGQTVDQLVQWLQAQTDCNSSNGELCNAWDPVQWNNSNFGVKGFFFLQNNCDDNVGFPLGATDMQAIYGLIKNQFLWRYVMDNPELFGGSVGGFPDISFNPGWYTNDPDNFTCP